MASIPQNVSESTRKRNPDLYGGAAPAPMVTAASMLEKQSHRESDLHEAIIEHCKANGWIYFHGSMAHRALRTLGEPDFQILANDGRVFFVECKTKTGKLSPQQLALKVWAEKLGHTIHECRSMDQFREIVR